MAQDEIVHGGKVYRRFHRLDGLNDLYEGTDGHVYHKRGNHLFCAWAIINLNNEGVRVEQVKCQTTPTTVNKCAHIVTPFNRTIVNIFRGTRIALCHLKSLGINPKVEKADVLAVMAAMNQFYDETLVMEFDKFYDQRQNQVRYVREHPGKPWSSSGTLAVELAKEEVRFPGFRAVIDDLVEAHEAEEDNAEPAPQAEPEAPENPHIVAAREHLQAYALEQEGVLNGFMADINKNGRSKRTRFYE